MIITHEVDPCYIYLKSALRMDIKLYILFLGSLLWNELPPDLKELSNTKMFKQKLKIYLLSQ